MRRPCTALFTTLLFAFTFACPSHGVWNERAVRALVTGFLRWNATAEWDATGVDRFRWYLAQSHHSPSYSDVLVAIERLHVDHGFGFEHGPNEPAVSYDAFQKLLAASASEDRYARARSAYPILETLSQSEAGKELVREAIPALKNHSLRIHFVHRDNRATVTLLPKPDGNHVQIASDLELGEVLGPVIRILYLALHNQKPPYLLEDLRPAYETVHQILTELTEINPSLRAAVGENPVPSDSQMIADWDLQVDKPGPVDCGKQIARRGRRASGSPNRG